MPLFLKAGKEAFKAAGMAGKLVVFHHNLPVAEAPGKLKNRDDRKCLGTEKEKTVLTPQTKFYNDLGEYCCSEQNLATHEHETAILQ
jgi:protein transport protein SEC24